MHKGDSPLLRSPGLGEGLNAGVGVTHRGEGTGGRSLPSCHSPGTLPYLSTDSCSAKLSTEALRRGCPPASRTAWSELFPPPGPALPQRPAHLSFHGHEGTSRGTGPLTSRAHTRLHCWRTPESLEVTPTPALPPGQPTAAQSPGAGPRQGSLRLQGTVLSGHLWESPRATDRCL